MKRANVAERWISSQATSAGNSPKASASDQSSPPRHSTGNSPPPSGGAAFTPPNEAGSGYGFVPVMGGTDSSSLPRTQATYSRTQAGGFVPGLNHPPPPPSLNQLGSSPYTVGRLPRLHLFSREPRQGFKDPSSRAGVSGSPETLLPSAGNEKLYEAYNDLHSLAQDFDKPFEAPAILLVGHQTDGKSALIEALMGFQFNHVGGGTKTRRPIALQMKYNAACSDPVCYLITEDGVPREEERSLDDIQAYIESENLRLERDGHQFWSKEIILKIEYRYCPNLTIIDTPGLIAPAPGSKNNNNALQAQAKAVEALVRSKMQHKEFIILCLEDCSDWSNATTRRVVMQVDPELSRTIIVSTKLDTRIPQFARAADVELFLRPPSRLLDADILGGTPFFTSVPSGRVGSGREAVFKSNEQFREAVAARELEDVSTLEEKLGRPLLRDERSHVGVSRLRWFLEQLLQRKYLENVPSIVPLLDREYRNVTLKLHQTVNDLSDLDEIKLKERGRLFRDSFLAKLSLLLKGTVVAPPEKFGETLQDERIHGGAFVGADGLQMSFKHMPNAGMRLFGGAQYHRAMGEFRYVVGGMKCPVITREEIVNACGVEDIHDGTNYFRTACVIAVSKARDVFEPFLHQLGYRLSHVLRRLLPIALFLLQKDGEYLSGHDMFMKRVSTAFHLFVECTERACREKCMEDLLSTTRYVSWSLHNRNRAGLRQFLDAVPFSAANEQPNPSANSSGGSGDLVSIARQDSSSKTTPGGSGGGGGAAAAGGGGQIAQTRLVDLLDSTLWNRRLAQSSEDIVNALVAKIFEGIRDHFVISAELKFNCFFLMPVVDKFPALLREDLEVAFEEDLDRVFDVTQARQALEQHKFDLEHELRRVERLQEKFAAIHQQLSSTRPHVPIPPRDTAADDDFASMLTIREKQSV